MSKGLRHYPLSAIRYPLLVALAMTAAACAPKGEALYNRANEALAKGDNRAAVIDLKNLVRIRAPERQGARTARPGARPVRRPAGRRDRDPEGQGPRRHGRRASWCPSASCSRPRASSTRSSRSATRTRRRPPPRCRCRSRRARPCSASSVPADAKVQFEAALAAKPDSAEALLGLAAAAYQTEGLPAAKAVIDKAPESVKKQPRYWMASGGINLEGGDLAGRREGLPEGAGSRRQGRGQRRAPDRARRAGRGADAPGQDQGSRGDHRAADEGGARQPDGQAAARAGGRGRRQARRGAHAARRGRRRDAGQLPRHARCSAS